MLLQKLRRSQLTPEGVRWTISWCCDSWKQLPLRLKIRVRAASASTSRSPPSRHRHRSRCRCCLESFLPHTSAVIPSSPSSADVVWHILPVPTPLHPHLYTISLPLHLPVLATFCLSICSFSQFPVLSSSSSPHFPNTHPTVWTPTFPSCFSSSLPCFYSLPDLDRDDLSDGDDRTERCSEAKGELVVFACRGRVTVTCSQPGWKKATHTVTQAVWNTEFCRCSSVSLLRGA